MTYSFVGTEAFEKDHDEALAYLVYQLKSPRAASRLMDAMDAPIAKISENPQINAISRKPTLAALEYREDFVERSVLLYRIEGQDVVAKRLFPMSQDYESYM